MLGPLFEPSDWSRMPQPEHAYRPIRDLDDDGVQSWGVELIGAWLHLMNISGWKAIPTPNNGHASFAI